MIPHLKNLACVEQISGKKRLVGRFISIAIKLDIRSHFSRCIRVQYGIIFTIIFNNAHAL